MNHKALLIPVGTAVSALLANVSEATTTPVAPPYSFPNVQSAQQTGRDLRDPILKQLLYQIGEQAHSLTLHKSSSGTLFADHRSHSSHGSHRSGR